MNRYLFESRKKSFKKIIKSTNIFRNIEENSQNLIKSSKKAKNSNDNFLQKEKKKISKLLTEKYLENLKYISKLEGKDLLIEMILKVKMF